MNDDDNFPFSGDYPKGTPVSAVIAGDLQKMFEEDRKILREVCLEVLKQLEELQ